MKAEAEAGTIREIILHHKGADIRFLSKPSPSRFTNAVEIDNPSRLGIEFEDLSEAKWLLDVLTEFVKREEFMHKQEWLRFLRGDDYEQKNT